MKIAIFDSGIGGLCLLAELSRRLPDERFIYYADSDNAPYGERSPSEVLSLTESAVLRLLKMGADAILLACNTATAVSAQSLRERMPTVPIFGMEPAVNHAAKEIPSGLILATATAVTLKGEKYRTLLHRAGIEDRVISLPLPSLVRYAEGELFGQGRQSCPEAAEYIEKEIRRVIPHPEGLSAAVLGCTHFIFFREGFRRILPDTPIYDGVEGTANHLIRSLGLTEGRAPKNRGDRIEFLVSGREASCEEQSRFCHCLELLNK